MQNPKWAETLWAAAHLISLPWLYRVPGSNIIWEFLLCLSEEISHSRESARMHLCCTSGEPKRCAPPSHLDIHMYPECNAGEILSFFFFCNLTCQRFPALPQDVVQAHEGEHGDWVGGKAPEAMHPSCSLHEVLWGNCRFRFSALFCKDFSNTILYIVILFTRRYLSL